MGSHKVFGPQRIGFLLFLCATPLFSATITIVNLDGPTEGFNDPTAAAPVGGNTGITVGQQRLEVFQQAADIWGRALVSSVPIRVAARFDPLSCTASQGVLGSAGPVTVIRDFAGAPRPGMYYTIALANAFAGQDLDPDDDDIEATFNSDIGKAGCLANSSWYYGLDNNTPPNAFNLLETILHEFGHGLGFVSLVNLSTGARLNGFNDAFINNLEDHATGKTYPQMTDTERRSANIAGGNLHWIGSNVVARSGLLSSGGGAGGHVEMYAPNPLESGSSVSHFSTSLAPDELMEPYATPTVDMRLTLELLKDVGWTVAADGPSIVAHSTAIVTETCGPANGVIDAGESVAVNFSLRNLGSAAASNVVATLLATGGVTLPSAPQNFGALLPNASAITRVFSFLANSACGSSLTATLQLQDGTNNLGTVAVSFNVGRTMSFTNTAPINLPQSGIATPYPSTIAVSGLAGTISRLTVKLANVHHSNPDDMDVLLVNPNGQSVLLMSDAGGSSDLSGVNLTFDDAASGLLPDSTSIVSGAFKPTNFETNDGFPAPAPVGSPATTLSALATSPANGAWTLYVLDDGHPRSGAVAAGWSISFLLCCAGSINTPPVMALPSSPPVYVENSEAAIIDAAATLVDNDSIDFNGGVLTVDIVLNASPDDRLFIRNQGNATGELGVTGNTVSFGGVAIGTMTGGNSGPDPLTVNFMPAATLPALRALLRSVAFSNVSDVPLTAPRTVRLTISDGDGGTSLPVTKVVAVAAVNDPPTLLAIADRTLNEGHTLVLTNVATDPETVPGALTFVALSAAAGVAVEPTTGVLTWTPDEEQGPATNLIRVIVSDSGAPTLTATQNFTVVVMEVNEPPVLAAIPDRTVHAGMLITFTNAAIDSDVPSNIFQYALSNAPAGASLHPSSGLFTWTPTVSDANATNIIGISVVDDGIPPAAHSRSFSIMVLSDPRIESVAYSNGLVSVTWFSIAGVSYRVQFKTSLDEGSWTDVPGDVTATGAASTKLHAQEPAAQRFYRVRVQP